MGKLDHVAIEAPSKQDSARLIYIFRDLEYILLANIFMAQLPYHLDPNLRG